MPESTTLPEVDYGLNVGGDSQWEVVRVHFTEALGEPYEGLLEVACEGGDPSTLLGSRCVFTARRGEVSQRRCGVVVGVRDRGWVARRRVVELQVAPALWLLGLRSTYRIFQNLDALEVVAEVLKDAGQYQGELLAKRLGPLELARREYCTQYGETDLAFIRRLLEEEGITLGFDHAGEAEALVLTNGGQADIFPELDTGGAVAVVGQAGETEARETVRSLDRADRVVSTGVHLRDYDFTHPAAVIDQRRDAPDVLGSRQRMEYPARVTLGEYQQGAGVYGPSDARRLMVTRDEEALVPAVTLHGWSNVTALAPGQVLSVQREDDDEPERLLVLRVTHLGEAPEVLHLDEATRPRETRYQNAFECVPATVHYRPPRVTPRPRALTPQSAVVVAEPAASADAICTDVHGRVKVRFQWDRPAERTAGQSGLNASCWLRVTQAWAGAGWGFWFLPRVGMEVLVQFLDGDPDRPVVTGCLYNAVSQAPERMPESKTRSFLRTRSTPGDGHNELSFEDEGGKEQVHLRAQRDYTELVLNDHTVTVKRDEVGTVERDQTWTVHRHRAVTVKQDDALTVERNRTVTITENDALEVSKNLSVTVFEASTLTVSKTHTVAVDEGVKVTVGGNSGTRLEMEPQTMTLTCGHTKITLTETAIALTAGGVELVLDESSGVKAKMGAQSLALTNSAATLAGVNTSVEASAQLALKGQASAELSATGLVQVQGALVKIN